MADAADRAAAATGKKRQRKHSKKAVAGLVAVAGAAIVAARSLRRGSSDQDLQPGNSVRSGGS